MPMVYVKNELYNRAVKGGKDPSDFVNEAVEQALEREGL